MQSKENSSTRPSCFPEAPTLSAPYTRRISVHRRERRRRGGVRELSVPWLRGSGGADGALERHPPRLTATAGAGQRRGRLREGRRGRRRRRPSCVPPACYAAAGSCPRWWWRACMARPPSTHAWLCCHSSNSVVEAHPVAVTRPRARCSHRARGARTGRNNGRGQSSQPKRGGAPVLYRGQWPRYCTGAPAPPHPPLTDHSERPSCAMGCT